MPTPVNAGTLWAVAQNLVAEGLNFTNAWEIIRESDFPTTRDVFVAVYQRAAEVLSHRRFLADQDLGYVPTYEGILDSALNYDRAYAYRVEISGEDVATGEETTMYSTQLYDRPVPLGDAVTDALAEIALDPDIYQMQPTSARVFQVERSLAQWAPWLAGGIA